MGFLNFNKGKHHSTSLFSNELQQQLPSPAYILDQNILEHNLQIIKTIEAESGAEFLLALKGFAMWSCFPILNSYGFHKASASSLWEARLAMEEMGAPAHTYSPAYTPEEFDEIAAMSSHITFNSISQYQRFYERALESNVAVSLGLRVNPELSQVAVDLYNPCIEGSRLGIPPANLPKPNYLPSNIEGFHCHALCEADAESSAKLIETFEEKFREYLPHLKWVNFGGGHLVTRANYQASVLIAAIKKFKAQHPHLQVFLEPGSAFAWDCGYLMGTVEDIVTNHGVQTAIMNVSFTAHMPDCLEMPYQPQILGSLDLEQPKGYRYRIGGNSCLSGDYMGDWAFDHPLEVGEKLFFKDMIHYTMVKTTTFNGVKHPAICMVKDNQLIHRKTFTYADYKDRLS